MNIMLVSQCSKQALPGTRRILDQFAERKGSRTWLTPITEIGLQTLHQMLRQRARRNTAVACHWVRGSNIELLWVVGNRRKFNRDGNVPTDTRKHSVLNNINEDKWHHTEGIALLAAIAGLFHDFGKANSLFQKKLVDSKASKSEPIRHEWLSVRLFQSFVADQTDQQWLQALKEIQRKDGAHWIKNATQDGVSDSRKSPLVALRGRQVALAVCWLILTHHRLPYKAEDGAARGDEAEIWSRKLAPDWNSPQFSAEKHDEKTRKALWRFKNGLPVNSSTWRKRAQQLADRALGYPDFFKIDWYESTFCLHVARCALMLADHCYSAAEKPVTRWQDSEYHVYANTRKSKTDNTRNLHQQLDEHCCGVAHYAFLFAKNLPELKKLLPAVGDVRSLRKHSTGKFAWQNKAFLMAKDVRLNSEEKGGFFLNMASTGTGKTIANARMAYGLSNENDGCRFNILLGLRTLTLQTGKALQERIGLGDTELATLVGSSIVRELHSEAHLEVSGSESSEDVVDKNDVVYYEGELTQSKFGEWLGNQRRKSLMKLLSAPVLVSTIDYLVPATESARGGGQLAPMMRLLSSDIVLDEPDDFGLKDQPALCRLVYWSGMLGGRVILSSATLAPALIEALFAAYRAGRLEYSNSVPSNAGGSAIVCGWVDEHGAKSHEMESVDEFVNYHKKFVKKRIGKLEKTTPRRLADLLPLVAAETPQKSMAGTIASGIWKLHECHGITDESSDKKISVGLVRMANINPLVAVAQELAHAEVPEDTEINVCVYHARHLLLRRHLIEKDLDSLLNRSDENLIWNHKAIQPALKRGPRNQIFIVLATAVAEVGRDHCYDWAIVEPSSMRSIVQLAGRVLRHREYADLQQPNMLLLEKNFKALRGITPCFSKPGFESDDFQLANHELTNCLPIHHYQHPAPRSCITESDDPDISRNIVDMEHAAMRAELLSKPKQSWPASLWWRDPVRWAYQMQYRTRFRKGPPNELHALVTDHQAGDFRFERLFNDEWSVVQNEFQHITVDCKPRVHWWITPTDQELLSSIAAFDGEIDIEYQCRTRLTLDLEKRESASPSQWSYHEVLGVYRPI